MASEIVSEITGMVGDVGGAGELLMLPDPLLWSLALVVGAVVGSFLNVVAWRLPIMLERSWQGEARELLAESSLDKNLDKNLDGNLDETLDETPDAKSDAKTEATSGAKSDARMEATSDAKSDAKMEATSDAKSDAKMEATSDAKSDAKMEATSGAKSDASKHPTFNLAWPPSHCPACQHPIRLAHNLPIIGYFLAARRCGNCQAPISPRYPLVELATALLTLAVIIKLGLTPPGLAALVLTWVLIAITLIDQSKQLIPDSLTLPFLWLGLGLNLFGFFTDIESALLGCMAGYLCLWLVYQAFKLLTGKEGMGYGDFKLLALLGAWMGWQQLPMIILLASIGGALVGGVMIALGHNRNVPIPFGPWLAAAGWITLLWGDAAMDYYLALFW